MNRQHGIDVSEVRDLLRDYRRALPLCQNGALLKEELARLNLRAYNLGLTLPPDTLITAKFHDVVRATSERKEQGGLYVHMDDARNLQRWIDFLTELLNPEPALLAVRARSEITPLL